MPQQIFIGTEQEYDRYRKKRKYSPVKIKVIEEISEEDFETSEEESIVPDEDLPKSHILHPSNRKWLLKELEKGKKQIKEGNTFRATPEFFEDIKKRGRERLLATQK